MRTIPFGKPLLGDEEKRAVMAVLEGPILVHGPRATQFEGEFARYVGAQHAVSVSSCTAGLHLVYFDLGIGPGDEVIVPAQTHVATAHAVELCGARPVFVDAEIETGNIDLDALAGLVTGRTRAISVVHFLGYPVAMDRVLEIARSRGLFVVEDCALAVGTRYRGRHAGTFGDAGCFSFYPVKHMTTAEGGMIVTSNDALAQRLQKKRAFGVDRHAGERKIPGEYDVPILGFNYRMSEIHAALGIEQTRRLDAFLAARQTNAARLTARLRELEGITLFREDGGDFRSSRYCLSVLLDEFLVPVRSRIVEFLKERGVGTSIYYPRPVPHMTYYRERYGYAGSTFPVAARISASSISLPIGPHLGVDDMEYIAEALGESLARERRN